MEQSERDKDDELSSKNRKLNKKIDKYKRELNEAQQDISVLKSELEHTRQDKVCHFAESYYLLICFDAVGWTTGR